MSADHQRRYRFATAAQWVAGLSARVDGDTLDATGAVMPFAPYQDTPAFYKSTGAFAPAGARDGRIFWRAAGCALLRLDPGDDRPQAMTAPAPPNQIHRMAVARDSLWLSGGSPAELRCHDTTQLARRFVVKLAGMRLIDFAGDGRDGVWALAAPQSPTGAEDENGEALCIHFDCAGYELQRFAPAVAGMPIQLARLARGERLVILAAGGKRLYAYSPGNPQPLYTVDIDGIRPCFEATWLASDGRSRVVLAGLEHAAWGGGATGLTLDADGQLLHALALPGPATGIHATRGGLLVTTAEGLLHYMPGGAGATGVDTRCDFVTPVLQSPLDDNPRRWLRVEALATLPPGTSLEISYAATADPEVQEKAARVAADRSVTGGRRLALLREYLQGWKAPMVFRSDTGGAQAEYAVPLFDVHEPWLWVSVALLAAPGAALPRLERLDVLYPGRTLMEYLPRVYQRAEAGPDNFLRALVGVIETGTQEQDRRIAAMGGMIAPETAPPEWLDYVARWLDLPWDDALDEQQKRRVLASADLLASRRGTRAGLETLLAALLPGAPPPYRLVDVGAQYGFAALGAAPLPALLGGLPVSAAALNRKAILGKARLTCADSPPDDVSRLAGQITLSVTATLAQRSAWEPWLANLVGAMLPATTRLVLRWASVAGRLLDERLGGDYALNEAPAPHLGTDAVTGLARLGSANGPDDGPLWKG
jgi:phage tail-like protein